MNVKGILLDQLHWLKPTSNFHFKLCNKFNLINKSNHTIDCWYIYMSWDAWKLWENLAPKWVEDLHASNELISTIQLIIASCHHEIYIWYIVEVKLRLREDPDPDPYSRYFHEKSIYLFFGKILNTPKAITQKKT